MWVVVDGVLDLSSEADSTCNTQVRWTDSRIYGREHTNDKKAVFPDPLGPSNTNVDRDGLAALR